MTINLTVSGKDQPLSIRTRPEGSVPDWWLDLDLYGQPIYRIGNVCETCQATFARVSDASLPLTPSALSKQLGRGLKSINPQIIETVSRILPEGTYCVGLLNIKPELKHLSRSVPSHSFPEYYWNVAESLGLGHKLETEAVLPIVAEKQLSPKHIKWYEASLRRDEAPTALALSYLDFRVERGSTDVVNFVHFLLDGHHKMMAASKLNMPISLLSFFTTSNSMAAKRVISELIKKRYQDFAQ